jgi:hypothetical protein
MMKFFSFATWCPACRGLQPTWEEFASWSTDLEIGIGQVSFCSNRDATDIRDRYLAFKVWPYKVNVTLDSVIAFPIRVSYWIALRLLEPNLGVPMVTFFLMWQTSTGTCIT